MERMNQAIISGFLMVKGVAGKHEPREGLPAATVNMLVDNSHAFRKSIISLRCGSRDIIFFRPLICLQEFIKPRNAT